MKQMSFAIAVLAFQAGAASAFDLSNPADVIRLDIATGCMGEVTNPGVYFWQGEVFGRRTGEPDRHLFNVQGINPRACELFNDAQRGPGYRAVARELMIYLDPETN